MKHFKRCLLIVTAVLYCHVTMASDVFKLSEKSPHVSMRISKTFNRSSTVPVSFDSPVSGLAISGNIHKDSSDYVVRVIMTDKTGEEHLVMELYEEINDSSVFYFSDHCEETALLYNVIPAKINVYVKHATVNISEIKATEVTKSALDITSYNESKRLLRKSQSQEIIAKINAYNRKKHKLWVAGETALSQRDYYTRKITLGISDETSSCGIEYYVDGFFEFPGNDCYTSNLRTSSGYADKFDWRDRHGKNLITSVKDQTGTQYCSAFATVGCVEALTNLYFNKNIPNLDLSEMEIACCCDTTPYKKNERIDLIKALQYVVNYGICDETSYPFEITNTPTCYSGNITPNELIRLSNYDYVGDLRSGVINKGPIICCLNGSIFSGHAVVMMGYGTIHQNDTVGAVFNMETYTYDTQFVDANDPRIGKNYWILKNSWGENNNFNTHGGYIYVLDINNPVTYRFNFELPLTSLNYTANDVVVEDNDGDGIYNWGIGPKPSWIPNYFCQYPDGDDANDSIAFMDDHGNFSSLDGTEDILISNNSIFNHSCPVDQNWIVEHGWTLTVTGDFCFIGKKKIIVQGNSELIIDGGTIVNAEIIMHPYSTLTVINGGKIYMRKGVDFNAPVGTTVNITEGEILGPYQINPPNL